MPITRQTRTWAGALPLLLATFPAAADSLFTGGGEQVALNEEFGLKLLYADEAAVDIATGTPKPLRFAPSMATVVTADDIEAMGAHTLDEVLERIPGLHVSRSFNRLNALWSIRGVHTGQNPQVLMLMNGVPVRQLITGGRPNTFLLPTAHIARVEVIRGPGSALYGADAFAGVVNVITKDPRDLQGTRIGFSEGAFDTHYAWLQHGHYGDTADLTFDLEWLAGDGDDGRVVDADLQSGIDPRYSFAPGPLATRTDVVNTRLDLNRDDWHLGVWGWLQRDGGTGPGAAQALDPIGSTEVDYLLTDLAWKPALTRHWELDSRVSYQYLDAPSEFVLLPPGTTVPIGPDGNLFSGANPNCAGARSTPAGCLVTFTDGLLGNPHTTEDTAAIDLATLYTGFEWHRLRLGLGFQQQHARASETKNFGPGVIDGSAPVVDGTLTDVTGTPNIFMEEQRREVWYAFVQDEWHLAPDWELTAGIRYDSYSDFGASTNPRLALVWAPRYDLTAKLLYGRAFRAPTFSELYFINNPSLLGNPDLDPETIDTVELGLDYQPAYGIHGGVSLYRYHIDDLVDFVRQPDTTTMAENAREQDGWGIELELKWALTDTVDLYANYAYQEAENAVTGDPVADAPGQQAYLDLRWEPSHQWLLGGQVNWIADRERAAGDTRSNPDDYTTVDVTVRRRYLAQDWELAASVRNLFDSDGVEPSNGRIPGDYPIAGRSWFLEARYRFGS